MSTAAMEKGDGLDLVRQGVMMMQQWPDLRKVVKAESMREIHLLQSQQVSLSSVNAQHSLGETNRAGVATLRLDYALW